MLALASVALVAAGCGGAKETAAAGGVPASAKQAPANALAYVSVDTDMTSAQWTNAKALVSLFPSVGQAFTSGIDKALADDQLDWATDVEPALGRELVVVVTADSKPLILLQPKDAEKLDHLLESSRSDEMVKSSVGGWTVLAQHQAEIDAYSAALDRGSLETTDTFAKAIGALPDDALVKAWVDGAGLTENLQKLAAGAEGLAGGAVPTPLSGAQLDGIDFDLESIAMALAARENGLYVAVGARGGKLGNGTHYEPKLFAKVPADAVAAISFGGTQGTVDKLSAPLDKVSETLESAVGVSLDKVMDAFSGEGVVYLRRGSGTAPEVTAVLSPPDADETLATLDTVVRKLAERSGGQVTQTTLDDIAVSRLDLQGVPLSYGKLDDDTLIVTIGSDAIAAFNGSSERLADSDAFKRAADEVGLADRTAGFVYVDLDGLVPLITGFTGEGAMPVEARDVLSKLDAFILQTSPEDNGMQVSGFVRVNR